MRRIEFDREGYARLTASGFKYIELNATGEEVETSTDCFKKVILLVPHKAQPTDARHYVLEIDDLEVQDLFEPTDTDVFLIDSI
jgi:hypothetical protein